MRLNFSSKELDFELGRWEVVFGTVTVLTADNLASHSVGSFKLELATGFRKCRYCLKTQQDRQRCVTNSLFK